MKDKTLVTALEPAGKEFFKVIMPSGMIETVHRNELDLQVINTKYFEKLDDSAA